MAAARASRLKAEPTSPKTKENQTSIAPKANRHMLDKAAARVVAKAEADGAEEGVVTIVAVGLAAEAAEEAVTKRIEVEKETRVSFFFCFSIGLALLSLSAHGSFRGDHHQERRSEHRAHSGECAMG